MKCGQQADYVGTLVVSGEGPGYYSGGPQLKGAFCKGCTRTPHNRWLRQFVSDRPAVAGETCEVPKES